MPVYSVVACEVVTVIDFQAAINNLGEKAAIELRTDTTDAKALEAMNNKGAQDRIEAVRSWLQRYQVFQGIEGSRRSAIAEAILAWADARDIHSSMSTVDALDQAHREIVAVCVVANGKARDFTSLASKALWLCYPYTVPMFDRFAQRALWAISKMDDRIPVFTKDESEYRRFVRTWKEIYQQYAVSIDSIDIGDYQYRVRLFDRILWIVGYPDYIYA